MAVIKCKMCGGDLNIAEGLSVAECEYCGTKQTLPTSDDEAIQGLFNRANTLRIKSEFDKAENLYEKIIQSDETQAEAYWGLILCKYGIEYVEDPKTFKRIPTCHRASFDSIIADEDYKSALEYADVVQKSIYEEQAAEIDRIQKEILAISQKEEPYDVFICYKETDEAGKRTQDSVIANDIYYQLTREGLKVFYAAITLENKLGSAYEPCIFAALNSAKVMLAIGTKPEYFNAVWVKNEWSRFLKIIKKDSSKLLIPCYRDMDAYELPDEFAHLQAQDMSKIGFINDIVRGIKKVVVKEDDKTNTINTTASMPATAGGNITSLVKRGYMALDDKNWTAASEFFDRVLDADAENADCYVGKFLIDCKVSSLASIKGHIEARINQIEPKKYKLEDKNLLEKRANIIIDNIMLPAIKKEQLMEKLVYDLTYISNSDNFESFLKIVNDQFDLNKNYIRALEYAGDSLLSELKSAKEEAVNIVLNAIESEKEQTAQRKKNLADNFEKFLNEKEKEIINRKNYLINEKNTMISKIKELMANSKFTEAGKLCDTCLNEFGTTNNLDVAQCWILCCYKKHNVDELVSSRTALKLEHAKTINQLFKNKPEYKALVDYTNYYVESYGQYKLLNEKKERLLDQKKREMGGSLLDGLTSGLIIGIYPLICGLLALWGAFSGSLPMIVPGFLICVSLVIILWPVFITISKNNSANCKYNPQINSINQQLEQYRWVEGQKY